MTSIQTSLYKLSARARRFTRIPVFVRATSTSLREPVPRTVSRRRAPIRNPSLRWSTYTTVHHRPANGRETGAPSLYRPRTGLSPFAAAFTRPAGADGRQSHRDVFNGRETAHRVSSPCAAVRTKLFTRWRTVSPHGSV